MSSPHAAPHYFVPGPSKWPMLAGMSLLATMIGASGWVNGASWGPMLNIAGILPTLMVLYFWFGDAIGESESGKYGKQHRPVLPLVDELVHLLRSDVLRRLLRRAVLCPLDLHAVAGRPRPQVDLA